MQTMFKETPVCPLGSFGRLQIEGLHFGSLESRATDFGSRHLPTCLVVYTLRVYILAATLWESSVSGIRFWIWSRTHLPNHWGFTI